MTRHWPFKHVLFGPGSEVLKTRSRVAYFLLLQNQEIRSVGYFEIISLVLGQESQGRTGPIAMPDAGSWDQRMDPS